MQIATTLNREDVDEVLGIIIFGEDYWEALKNVPDGTTMSELEDEVAELHIDALLRTNIYA